ARAFYTSIPLAAYWVLLLVLLVAGFVGFRRLLLSPGSLAMHLGSVLIILGAMWGSEPAHRLRTQWLGPKLLPVLQPISDHPAVRELWDEWFGGDRVSSGFMPIMEGEATDVIVDQTMRNPVGKTPFRVGLRDFWIDYYPTKGHKWHLVLLGPVEGTDGSRQEHALEWAPDQEFLIPHTPVRMQVLQYLPAARPMYTGGGGPGIRIQTPEGQEAVLPAEVGREVAVGTPPVRIKVVEIFMNLKVEGAGADRRVYDAGPPGSNPAVRVEVTEGEKTQSRLLFARMPMHGQPQGGLQMQYAVAPPTGAEADPASDAPAMEVLLKFESREERRWLIPDPGQPMARLPLGPIQGKTGADAEAAAELYLVQPRGDIQHFNSDLVVLKGDEEMAHQAIRVNEPMHYGGYHFYQHSYDNQNGQYTVLSVVSDTGLNAVWAGFILLVGGAALRMWASPVWRAAWRAAGGGKATGGGTGGDRAGGAGNRNQGGTSGATSAGAKG
ncbi:MAG: cytochrome c biogenesis protein ResB, partial [Planctomycetes bacterium]|nr:cytochrome c biogenesis protein ResB [Planctomycetota bacterium]